MPASNLHTIAVAAIGIGYVFIVGVLGILVLVLHDGAATVSVVASLTQLGWAGLAALVFIVTGRSLISVIGTSATAMAPQATTQVVNQNPTAEEKQL